MRKTNINWLKKKREGLYCVPGNFFIDPVFPVEKALITHAHTDHARPNNKYIFSSKETIELMHLRYGESYCSDFQIARFDEKIKINDVTVQIHPAGHILGSIQFLINYNGYRLLISGDYKRTKDKTCLSYEPVKCDTFITEATFGLPIFNHPNDQDEVKKLIKSIISGSIAQFLRMVIPLAKHAAIIVFSVAPTLIFENLIFAPFSFPLVCAWI